MVKLKICGITNLSDALFCADNGADALGFVIYEKSKRYISVEKAEKIIVKLPPFVVPVAVTVNPDNEFVNILKDIGFNTVQLHGKDNITVTGIKKIVSISYRKIAECSDKNGYILVDSAEIGGTGKTFDWNLLERLPLDRTIVSGGINQYNIGELLSRYKPYAVDLSSSLETFPGKKDRLKTKRFIEAFQKAAGG